MLDEKERKPRKRHSESEFQISLSRLRQFTVARPDLAEMFDLSERHINVLETQGSITKSAPGCYPLVSAITGYVLALRDHKKATTASKAQAELQTQKARLVEAQIEEKKRTLIAEARQEAVSVVNQLVAELLSDIQAIPARMTRDMDERRKFEEEIERVQAAAYKRAERAILGEDDGNQGAEAEEATID